MCLRLRRHDRLDRETSSYPVTDQRPRTQLDRSVAGLERLKEIVERLLEDKSRRRSWLRMKPRPRTLPFRAPTQSQLGRPPKPRSFPARTQTNDVKLVWRIDVSDADLELILQAIHNGRARMDFRFAKIEKALEHKSFRSRIRALTDHRRAA